MTVYAFKILQKNAQSITWKPQMWNLSNLLTVFKPYSSFQCWLSKKHVSENKEKRAEYDKQRTSKVEYKSLINSHHTKHYQSQKDCKISTCSTFCKSLFKILFLIFALTFLQMCLKNWLCSLWKIDSNFEMKNLWSWKYQFVKSWWITRRSDVRVQIQSEN